MKTPTIEEVWKSVKGFEGIYEISNLGNVKSLNRFVNPSKGTKRRNLKEKIMANNINSNGYNQILLFNLSKFQNVKVHRLVAIAFIPNPENKPQVNHINGIKTDNRVENLEWCNNKENIIHAYKNNLKKPPVRSNLTKQDVLDIRENKNKLMFKELAEIYGISTRSLYDIVRNITWKGIDKDNLKIVE